MHRGYIKLYRKSEENLLYFSEVFTKWQAWTDLVLIANHSKKTLSIRGNLISIKRGQTAYSEESLAQRWKWSRGKVRRFINYLKTEQQIEQQQSNVLNILTIKNYDLYHGNGTTDSTTDSTTDGQQTVQQTDTNNNDKNVNNVKNDKKNTTLASIEKTTFDFSTSKFLNLNGKIEKYQEKYPGINVQSEVLKMEAWLMSNQKNRKTHYERFINNWLSRAQDKAPKHSEGETVDERHKRELEETKRRLGY